MYNHWNSNALNSPWDSNHQPNHYNNIQLVATNNYPSYFNPNQYNYNHNNIQQTPPPLIKFPPNVTGVHVPSGADYWLHSPPVTYPCWSPTPSRPSPSVTDLWNPIPSGPYNPPPRSHNPTPSCPPPSVTDLWNSTEKAQFDNGTHRPPKFPRYNNNTNTSHQPQSQNNSNRKMSTPLKDKLPYLRPFKTPEPRFNPIIQVSTFMCILKPLVSPEGVKLIDSLWISEVKRLIIIIKNAGNNQRFYEKLRIQNQHEDKFRMLQVWAAMFLIDPEVCLKTQSTDTNSILSILSICRGQWQSVCSSMTSQKITEFFTVKIFLQSFLPRNLIPAQPSLSRPYAKRIQKDIMTFASFDINYTTAKKPPLSVIRREAGFFKSKMTHGIDRLLDLVKMLIETKLSDVHIEMSIYFKIQSIVRDFSETSNSRFEFADCLLNEPFDFRAFVLQDVLTVKKKLWAVCAIINCPDVPGTIYQSPEIPDPTLKTLNKLFDTTFNSTMQTVLSEFNEFVAIRQHLGLNRSHQMLVIDAFMHKKFGVEYAWIHCVKNMPMKSRKDFANIPRVFPEKNPQFTKKTQRQPVPKPKDVIDLTKNKDDSSQHSKKNDEAVVAKVDLFMEILDSLIKPYAVNRDDKLWKDKMSVFRRIIINHQNEPSFIDKLRNRCRDSKLDRIVMLRIWITLCPAYPGDRKTHTQDVVLKILSRAYLNAVDETGRKRLGELLAIRKHLMGYLPSDALSKGDMDLMSKPYVQRLMADNPDLIFKSKNRKADKILKAIDPQKKSNPVSTLPITELLKPRIKKTVAAEGIDQILDEAKLLFKTKENDVVSQMKSFAKIVRILSEHSISKESDFEFIDCLLTEPFRKKKGTLHGRLLLWTVCALLNYAHISNKKQDLPEPTIVYLSRQFKNSMVKKQDWLEFVAIRQHLGRGRSHQMSKIDKYADEICRSKFNWRNRVEKSRRLSREDFVTPENFMCHPKLAYTFYVNNNDSRKSSKQIESNNDESEVNDKAYDSDCESETGSVEILSDVEKPPALIVDLFSSDEEEDEVISKPIDSKRDELEMTLETKWSQDNLYLSDDYSSSEEQETSNVSHESNDLNQISEQISDSADNDRGNVGQINTKVPHTSNDLNQVDKQNQDDVTDDFNSNTGEQKTRTKIPHESTCKLNRSCKKSKSRIECESRCTKTTTTSSSSKITSSTKRVIECTCSVEFIKANRPTSVSDNKPEANVVNKVSPIVGETELNDLPTIIGIPYEVLNAKQFVTYIWDNNLVNLVEEPIALEIEKEVANLLALPLHPSSAQEQDNLKIA